MGNFKHIKIALVIILSSFLVVVAFGAPPKVIKTVPENGAQDVNPRLRQIRIVFDQDMERGFSICGSGPNYPETISKPRWINKRTIVKRVRLVPNHKYQLSINCPSYKSFRNTQGEPVEPYPIEFKTGSSRRRTEARTPALTGEGPPIVIEMVPENGARNVDPQLREIRVVFDQDMSRDSYSICGGGPKYPNIIGNPRWVDKRTIVMQVELLPRHEYQFGINCPSAKNFRSAQGKAVEPYMVRFRTGSGRGRAKDEKLSFTDNSQAVEELRRAIDENYSYRDLRKVAWDELFDKYSTKMKRAKTARRFAEAAVELLAHAEDMHIWVKVDNETVGGFKGSIRRNYNREVLEKTVPDWQKRSAAVFTGRFEDGIGYILIDSWSRGRAEALEQAYVALWEFAGAPGLIIDVRSNGGGAEPLAQKFAGCFIDEPKVYAQHVYRSVDEPGGFTKPNNRVLEPNKRRPRYRGKIAVLMGPANMSSCEAFLLMMEQVPGCKLVGETSYGSSGNPKPTDLGNGVRVFLPSWKAMRPNGTCFEGEGITPNISVETTETELLSRDAVLEAALRLLREP